MRCSPLSARTKNAARTLGLALFGLATAAAPLRVDAAPGFQALPGHIPAEAASARPLARLNADQPLTLSLALPLRHRAELQDLLHGLYDPEDARYGQYLTPAEFTARFSPTAADYDRAIAYARAMGLTVVATHANRTLLDVSATASQIERAFGLHLNTYQSKADGHLFYAPDADPQVPTSLSSVIAGVVGLSNASLRHPNLRTRPLP